MTRPRGGATFLDGVADGTPPIQEKIEMRHPVVSRPTRVTMASLALLCALTSCSTSPTTQPPAPAPTSAPAGTAPTQSAACTDALALQSSIEALQKVDVAQDGVPAMQAAVADVKAALKTAGASARAELAPSVAAVQLAFAGVQSATSGLTADNRKEKAPQIAAALKQLSAATTALSSTLKQGCPSR